MAFDDDRIRTEHESYGQISIGRVSTNPAIACYGSDLTHGHYIALEISTSTHDRTLNHDWYHADKTVIRIRLTELQFAQMISSMNQGGGVPCTIERMNGKMVADPPFTSKVETVTNEFSEKAKDIGRLMDGATKRLQAMVAPGGKTTKGELVELLREFEAITREISSNMPYMHKQFIEAAEKVVAAAKMDITAHIATLTGRAGIEPGSVEAPRLTLEAKKDVE